jgi:hypothetical protein
MPTGTRESSIKVRWQFTENYRMEYRNRLVTTGDELEAVGADLSGTCSL